VRKLTRGKEKIVFYQEFSEGKREALPTGQGAKGKEGLHNYAKLEGGRLMGGEKLHSS